MILMRLYPSAMGAKYQPIFESSIGFKFWIYNECFGFDSSTISRVLATDVLNVASGKTTFFDGTNVLTGLG
jgi:hypothetical protein